MGRTVSRGDSRRCREGLASSGGGYANGGSGACSAARPFDRVAELLQGCHQEIAVIALNFNDAVFNGAAGTTLLFQLAAQFLEFHKVQRESGDQSSPRCPCGPWFPAPPGQYRHLWGRYFSLRRCRRRPAGCSRGKSGRVRWNRPEPDCCCASLVTISPFPCFNRTPEIPIGVPGLPPERAVPIHTVPEPARVRARSRTVFAGGAIR